jgi:hypothetical protein
MRLGSNVPSNNCQIFTIPSPSDDADDDENTDESSPRRRPLKLQSTRNEFPLSPPYNFGFVAQKSDSGAS